MSYLLNKLIHILFLIIGLTYGNLIEDPLDEVISYRKYANKVDTFLKETNASEICKQQLCEYGKALLTKQFWAFKMFDAGGKIPSGIFEGNFIDLGSFDECLSIEAVINGSESITGKYCLSDIPVTFDLNSSRDLSIRNLELANAFEGRNKEKLTITFRLAICVPNGCSASDLQEFYQTIVQNIVIQENLCQTSTSQSSLDAGSIAFISFLGVILWLMIVSTLYDAALIYSQNSKPINPLFTGFSIITNGKKLFTIRNDSKQISCLNGIRVISTMWVILGHRYSIQGAFPIRNLFGVTKMLDGAEMMFLIQAPLSVDTFFLMSGLVLSYVYMSTMSKGGKFNIILYYIHRYLRLTPLLAVIMLAYITLVKHLGSGPLYPTTASAMAESCENSWWKALLYIQNYGDLDICVPQTWYLSADTQLFIISPILLVPLMTWQKFTLILTTLLTVASIIICFITAWYLKLGAFIFTNNDTTPDYMKYYYLPTHTRAAPWLIGILLGYFVFQVKHKKRIPLSTASIISLWMICLAVLSTCVFAGHNQSNDESDRFINAVHIALVRPVWAIAVGWVIYACDSGYGGPINWFLSLPIFQVIAKFTYSLYLIHYAIIELITGQMRTHPVISNGYEMYIFWGDFAFTFAISVICTLAFESPIIVLEKIIFASPKKDKAANTPERIEKRNQDV